MATRTIPVETNGSPDVPDRPAAATYLTERAR
jgi:hypothetical protein